MNHTFQYSIVKILDVLNERLLLSPRLKALFNLVSLLYNSGLAMSIPFKIIVDTHKIMNKRIDIFVHFNT